MSKRFADEAAISDLVAAAQATATQIPPSEDGASNIPTHEPGFRRNSHKRLHLISPTELKTEPGQSVHNDNIIQTGNKSSLINATDRLTMESPSQAPDKLRLISRDLNATNEISSKKKQQLQERTPQDELNDPRARDTSKYLVKTVLDLPIFVTIEGYRVASYSIDGEPHLCLPQLLQFIQQKFPLDKVIDKFEESLTNFISATPKQIEGFIKAIVLPQDATACPLIKRSDAEWVCLALYDQQTKEKWSNIVDLCSKSDHPLQKEADLAKKNSAQPYDGMVNKDSSIAKDTQANLEQDNQDQERASFSDGSSRQSLRSSSCGPSTEILSLAEGQLKLHTATQIEKTASNEDSPHNVALSNNEKLKEIEDQKKGLEQPLGQKNGEKLFESEAQDTILNLVRSVTSTLMIQVYHRCFGKCVGLYYPSLLKTSESDCIECSTCHKMLSPRRFIGHTHEAKELNVCHWGFNSYHWRNYIRLSRKQSMNNLDDDELLVQFNLLKSIQDDGIDVGSNFQETLSESETKSSSSINETGRNHVDTKLSKELRSHAKPIQACRTDFYNADLISNLSARPSTSRATMEELMKLPGASTSGHLQVNPTSISSRDKTTPDKSPYHWNVNQAPVASAHKTSLPACLPLLTENKESKYYPNSLMYGPFAPSLPGTSLGSPSSAMSRSNHNMTSLNFLSQMYRDSIGITHSASDPVCSANHLGSDVLMKQDIFVSTSLTKYLHSKGIHPKVAEDIVNNTLDYIQRARTLF